MSQAFDNIREQESQLLCASYSRYPLAITRGLGSRLWDADGKEYIDLLAGIAVAALGHCNGEVCQALAEQSHKLWHVSNLFYQEEQLHLAKLLLSTTHHEKAFFCNSGAEANEALIKLARRYMTVVKGRKEAVEIITLGGCFHGRTLGTLAATGRASLSDGFTPLPEGFSQVPAGDLEALRAAISPRTAAVLLEVVQGEGGIVPLAPEYLRGVEILCRENGILFLCDEVQCGLCRTGTFWAFQQYGLRPDAISMAKALANGLPMGAMLATAEMARGFVAGSHATTFGGGALASAVAGKCIEIMQRDRLADRAAMMGAYVKQQIQAMQVRLPGKIREVRGMGLMIGIELGEHAPEVWRELINRGYICNLSHNVTLRLLPPLTIEKEELDGFVETLDDILSGRPTSKPLPKAKVVAAPATGNRKAAAAPASAGGDRKPHKKGRHYAREKAFQVMYGLSFTTTPQSVDAETLRQAFVDHPDNEEGVQPGPEDYAWQLVEGVWREQRTIDDTISRFAKNWRVDRMGRVELTLLRLAVLELLVSDNGVPPKVAINEALELGSQFGVDDAKKFMNGILDAVAKALKNNTIQPLA